MKRFLLLLWVSLFPLLVHAGTDPLRKIAKDFGKKFRLYNNPRVALLSFPYTNGKTSSGSTILSERLTTYMAETRRVRVIERSLIKQLLEEQHLTETGVVDASAAQKIGKVAGVDVIITGTLNDLDDDETELNARALNAATGEVIAASRVVVERSWLDRPRFPNQPTRVVAEEEEEEKPVPNEAIMIGPPGGGRGAVRVGGRR